MTHTKIDKDTQTPPHSYTDRQKYPMRSMAEHKSQLIRRALAQRENERGLPTKQSDKHTKY